MRPMVEVESSSEVLEDDPWGPPAAGCGTTAPVLPIPPSARLHTRVGVAVLYLRYKLFKTRL